MLLGDHTFFAHRSADETKLRFVLGLHPGAVAFYRFVAFLLLPILAPRAKPSSSHCYCPSSSPSSRLVLCKFSRLINRQAKFNSIYQLKGLRVCMCKAYHLTALKVEIQGVDVL